MNINPQSNTDFTQVTCTVNFYYRTKTGIQMQSWPDVCLHKNVIQLKPLMWSGLLLSATYCDQMA